MSIEINVTSLFSSGVSAATPFPLALQVPGATLSSGQFKFNNATQNLATQVSYFNVDSNGDTIPTPSIPGLLTLFQNPTMRFEYTGISNVGDVFTLAGSVTESPSANPFSSSPDVEFSFLPFGQDGTSGTSGSRGSSGSSG